MMLYLKKDVTDVGLGIVAHGVNCQHAMGSGVAGAIRKKWPVVYDRFMAAPKGKTMLGTVDLIAVTTDDSLFVANCYTQQFYGYGGGRYADPEAVKKAMQTTFRLADSLTLPLYMPKIGCGLGGLDWEADVLPIINYQTETYPRVEVFICELEEVK